GKAVPTATFMYFATHQHVGHEAAVVSLLGVRRLLGPALFFFTAPATTELYPLSLHDALPISRHRRRLSPLDRGPLSGSWTSIQRSEEHTSELQSRGHLVCRLLLEKKK